jgi:hypothetical protein
MMQIACAQEDATIANKPTTSRMLILHPNA